MNIVVLTGRLVKNPEIKKTTTGKSVCTFSVAVDDGYGENKKTYFHQCVIWEGRADYLCRYGFQGAWVELKGKLTQRDYETSNGKRRITEVLCDELRVCDKELTTESLKSYTQQSTQQYTQPATNFSLPEDDNFSSDLLDIASDDLPF